MREGIAIAGTVIVDKIYGINAYPEIGQLTKINSIAMSVGGCVPNVGIDLKKLSPDLKIYAIGKIGSDEEGEYVKTVLENESLDISAIKTCSQNTSFTNVMSVVGGQRTFFTYPGASAELGIEDIDLEALKAKILHLGYFLLLDKIDNGDGVKILKKAKELGIKTSIDLVTENSDRYSLVIPALEYTDYLIINEVEAGMLTGIEPKNENLRTIAERLFDFGVKEKVIIHKPDISVCLSENGFTVLPSYELPDGYVKGTTGAGDAFCAGALLKIYQGKSDIDILEFASTSAVMALSAPDATSGLVTESEALELCKNFKRATANI